MRGPSLRNPLRAVAARSIQLAAPDAPLGPRSEGEAEADRLYVTLT